MRKLTILGSLLVCIAAVPALVNAASLSWAEYGSNTQTTTQSPYVVSQSTLVNAASLPWAEYGSNAQNTGQSPYVGPQSTLYNWKVVLEGDNGKSFVSPVVDASGTIYIHEEIRNESWGIPDEEWYYQSVKAIDRNGTVKWKREVGAECANYKGRTSLALGTNGLLYLSCGLARWNRSPRLYAIETGTGISRWELPMNGYETQSIGGLTVDSNNMVYLTSSYRDISSYEWGPEYHKVTAVSETGNIVWSTQLGQGQCEDITGPVLSPDQKMLYVLRLRNDGIGTLSSLSAETGLANWETEINDQEWQWQTATSFAVDANGMIWVATYRKPDPAICYGTAENLFGISPDGSISRRFPMEGNLDCGSHVRIGPSGAVYVTYDDVSGWHWDGTKWVYYYTSWDYENSQWVTRVWYCIEDGCHDEALNSQPIRGGFAAYDPNTGFKWRFELPDSHEANASPAIDANENIYFAASYGKILYSINKEGQVNWEFAVDSSDKLPYGVAPVIGLDGSVYVMGATYFYGIDRPTVALVEGTIKNLMLSGTLDANTGKMLIISLEQISSSPTLQAKALNVQSTIDKIAAIENRGILDSSTAEQLRIAIGQLIYP